MNTLLITLHVIICVFIILVVLLQVGRGAEAGAVFGGFGQANIVRGKSTFLGKVTTVVAVGFMITSFLLTYSTSTNSKSSVVEKIKQEEVQQPQPAAEKEPAPVQQPAAPVETQSPAPTK